MSAFSVLISTPINNRIFRKNELAQYVYSPIFIQVCEEQVEQHFTGVKTAIASHGYSLGEMTATQERHLSDQSERVSTWSRDQGKLVEQVNTRVNQFLLQDLKDDLPTGLLFLSVNYRLLLVLQN